MRLACGFSCLLNAIVGADETFDGPIYNGTVIGNSAVDGGLNNPEAVIHVCSGNGGPPSASHCPAGEPTDKNW